VIASGGGLALGQGVRAYVCAGLAQMGASSARLRARRAVSEFTI
jgi:hypothetical protein